MLSLKNLCLSFTLTTHLFVLAGCGADPSVPSRVQATSPAALTFDDFKAVGSHVKSTIWSNSLLLAKAAEASKEKERAARLRELATLDLKEYKYIDGDADTQLLIAYNKDAIILAMPGTLGRQDLFQDFQIVLTEAWDLGYDVHKGFFRKADVVDAKVLQYLSELKAIDAESGHQRKLWLTGHSQGGSVVQILAMRLLDKGYRAQGIVSFGSPKPGPDRFRVAYDSAYAGVTHRWINKFDIVPSMPLRDSWDHVGRQHFIDHDRDSITFDDNEVREYSRPVRGFRNHGIDEYIKNIGKSRP